MFKQTIVTLVLFSCVSFVISADQNLDFSKMPPRSQYWVNQSLDLISDTPQKTVHNAGNRGGCYLAVGLLLRDQGNDRRFALEVINEILKNQHTDRSDMKSFGVWRKADLPDESIDYNWREFVSTGLVVILERFADKVPDVLEKKIDAAVLMAGEGAMARDVSADYTNIAMMSAFLMDYAGTKYNRPDIKKTGMDKARIIYDNYCKYNAVSEFNSPTYDGVDMFAIGLWRAFGRSDELVKMGKYIEDGLWREIADFYNPPLLNFAGPYFRSYGMDVTRYNSITAIWVALSLQDEKTEPLPGKGFAKFSEIVYVNLCVCVGVNAPADAPRKFKSLDEPRQVNRDVYNRYPGSEMKAVSAYLTSDWMVGGAVGHRRDWNQIVPGTIHWKLPDTKNVGWLLVPAKMKCDMVADKDGLHIRRGGFSGDTLTLLIYSPNAKSGKFEKDSWKLSEISFDIQMKLDAPSIEPLDDKQMLSYTRDETSGVFALNFKVNDQALKSDELMTIKP